MTEANEQRESPVFNRSVQLTLANYGCESGQCEVAAQADSANAEEG